MNKSLAQLTSETTVFAQNHATMTGRVILLLDLDCFYAQCECVRLGYDSLTTPLALLQWNSVLAVTYPARKCGITRGDSWQSVAAKSNHQCLAVSVPLLTTENSQETVQVDPNASVEDDYRAIYEQSPEEQQRCRASDLGVRRFSSQGKASIERYRIASARIFQTVLETITDDIVLERASIDEFFLDVTAACCKEGDQQVLPVDDGDFQEAALKATRIIGDTQPQTQDSMVRALQVGCSWAYRLRTVVRERLGFTLSAGIATNKTLAKLAAGYGKPNGQAVVFPDQVGFLLQETPLRKCRNLGGKLGKKVQALLEPMNVPITVASIGRYLTLPMLQQALGYETAAYVWSLGNGTDTEAVVSKNDSALTKSITAFKSLPVTERGHLLEDCREWIRLLAHEIVTRVERDSVRNSRYPKLCTLQYYSSSGGKRDHHNNKSLRTPFPSSRLSSAQKIQELVDKFLEIVTAKEGKQYRVDRLGFCAVDFVSRASSTQAIDHYFSNVQKSPKGHEKEHPTADAKESSQSATNNGDSEVDQDLAMAMKLQKKFEKESHLLERLEKKQPPPEPQTDPDLLLAQKLQAEYDRELRVVQALDRREKQNLSRATKTRRIDSFFGKR